MLVLRVKEIYFGVRLMPPPLPPPLWLGVLGVDLPGEYDGVDLGVEGVLLGAE